MWHIGGDSVGMLSQQVFPTETISRVRHDVSDDGTRNGTECVPESVPLVGTYRGEPCGLYHSGYIQW